MDDATMTCGKRFPISREEDDWDTDDEPAVACSLDDERGRCLDDILLELADVRYGDAFVPPDLPFEFPAPASGRAHFVLTPEMQAAEDYAVDHGVSYRESM